VGILPLSVWALCRSDRGRSADDMVSCLPPAQLRAGVGVAEVAVVETALEGDVPGRGWALTKRVASDATRDV
jgi:hypothetical protein